MTSFRFKEIFKIVLFTKTYQLSATCRLITNNSTNEEVRILVEMFGNIRHGVKQTD